MRGSWRPNRNFNILTPNLWPSTLCLSRSSDAQLEAQGPLCWVMAFFTASHRHLLRTSSHHGPKAPSAWCGFPNHISSITSSDLQLNWPLPVELNCLQLTGHSLLVHQSMSVPWEFFSSSHFNSQFPPKRFSLITAIRMCHFLPVHHLGMAFLLGPKVKI